MADELQKAGSVVRFAHQSASSLLDSFNALGQERGRGTSSNAQQDLLRAMLLFASAGLDACAKQTLRDALPRLASFHGDAREELKQFAVRRLRADGGESPAINAPFLAELLIGSTEENLIRAMIQDLTGASLQSVEGLFKVAAALGVKSVDGVKDAILATRAPFQARNKIAHEMDVDFAARRRNRVERGRDEMVAHTNAVLAAADALLSATDAELQLLGRPAESSRSDA